MFDTLEQAGPHPVAQLYAAFAQDSNPDKIDLGIGVYRDSDGRSSILPSVRQAMKRLSEKQLTKEYMSPVGNRIFSRLIETLVLGASHPALAEKRIVTFQTPGAGGGLRIAAELIRRASPEATIWASDPTWDHQLAVLASVNAKIAAHPYYDRKKNVLLFDQMLSALRTARPRDVVLLHGCCHNPTGEDLSREQWRALSQLCVERGLIPFIDLVYHGFGDGIEEDVFGTRLMLENCPEAILVTSASKSFGIYRDRAGTISAVGTNSAQAVNIERHLVSIASALYFMPPDTGAALVVEVLEDEALRRQWRGELKSMRTRIRDLRADLRQSLSRRIQNVDFGFIERQRGMFSLLPLSTHEVGEIRKRRGIYMMPDARINLAALTPDKVVRMTDAIAETLA